MERYVCYLSEPTEAYIDSKDGFIEISVNGKTVGGRLPAKFEIDVDVAPFVRYREDNGRRDLFMSNSETEAIFLDVDRKHNKAEISFVSKTVA